MRHIIFPLIFAAFLGIQPAAAQAEQITEDNIQIGYIIPGICGSFSPDSTLLGVSQSGMYEVATGKQKFPFLTPSHQAYFDDYRTDFSADGRYVLAPDDGVYDVQTGERLLTLWHDAAFSPDGRFVAISFEDQVVQFYDLNQRTVHFQVETTASMLYASVSFSSDSRWVGIPGQGIYDLQTGEEFIHAGDGALFSPDNQYVMTRSAVYDLTTGKNLVHISLYPGNFSSDSKLVVASEGVYSLPSGEKLYTIDHKYSSLSPNGQYLMIDDDAIYRVGTWERLADLPGGNFGKFSPDSQWVVYDDGGPRTSILINTETGQQRDLPFRAANFFSPDSYLAIDYRNEAYDLRTLQHRFVETGYGIFSPDGLYMAVNEYGTYREYYCVVYSAAHQGWKTRLEIVHANQVNVREHPSAQSGVLGSGSGDWMVIDRTLDNQWYKVRGGRNLFGWASASVLSVISTPEAAAS